MKALVIGCGSMGRRRIRLLKKIVEDIECICVDTSTERLNQIEKEGLRGYASLEKGIEEKPDIAFVCTSPGHHAEIIIELINAGIHVFTELNLTAERYDEILGKARERNVTVFMSSTMLYDKQIQKICELIKNTDKPLTYIYHVGQYLPDWHPWESYKDFFIGKKETNGVREIFAIQLPWIISAFGKIDSLYADRQRCTGLDIEFNDCITVNLRHVNGNLGVFVADTVSRKPTTSLEIIGEDLHIFWQGHNDDLFQFDLKNKTLQNIKVYDSVEHEEGYADNIIENQYQDEIEEFLNTVYKGGSPKYSLEDDKYTLSIIDKIEYE